MLADTVPEAARRFGDRPAFVAADGWSLSYADLHRLSDEAAVGLATRGVGEGRVVALTLPSSTDYVVAYLALAKLGAATCGINPRFTVGERDRALDVVRPDLVVGPEGDPPPAAPVATVAVTPARGPEEVLVDVRHRGGTPDPLDPDEDRIVTIVLTSGTTGRPKGAVFTNREIAAITRNDVGDGWDGGGPMLASTQFAHIGFMTKLNWYLRLGTTHHLLDRWRAADVLDLVERTRMTTLGGVAPQIALLLRDPDFDERDLGCVEALIVGAGPSPPALVAEARERFGAAYSIRYSSTESGGVGTATAFDAPDEEALYTVGRPRGDVELTIRDEHDEDVPDGEVGEVCLRSPCMLRRYWRDEEATAVALRGGWLHTGDLGRIDEAGCLRLAGRAKEMFIRGGYNVYPMEVEAVLASHPAVAEVAVVPRPDEVMGEIGVAVVVPRTPDAVPTLEDLRDHGAAQLSSYKLPEAVRVVDELPLTPMQKLDRRALAAAEADDTG